MFWEIASTLVQLAQLIAQMASFNKYKGKLEDFADQIKLWADDDKTNYQNIRANDIDFYNYYRTLPDYQFCQSTVDRSKGAAFHGYGSKLRRSMRTNRGYTPMTNVHLNNMVSSQAIAEAAVTRSVRTIKERNIVDDHVLERWSAIVSAPVGVERYYASAANTIISESFRNIKSLGQGFNSAGAAFGQQLYGLLNNE